MNKYVRYTSFRTFSVVRISRNPQRFDVRSFPTSGEQNAREDLRTVLDLLNRRHQRFAHVELKLHRGAVPISPTFNTFITSESIVLSISNLIS
jgi:hypothetical protein